ncbi:hypothetical protein A3K34_00275 [candidate division WWE3 bacterium RIFOXYC1_FULL_40_10]|uniref:Uncharacterized protein n=1 Tax=candidate division WWE3 bacterium RIFOXYA2_FULL_46_9 TaxID=1802636 RepID=A0A1F4W1D8_UNCKA|nr:MAG: hypothetical protein A3K58_00275 [candidate division WWE3 bacterium RIFOXYB1_FULL_40_22]OGC61329.1 MAG: hypothetical protein A3K37_00275 [candidate division WWE3 bacterium RIFOXYA1_FULL_40_11]OGC63239.1 MAG: hypothetical protein A2264_00930 [candidate division WWE3 bacterium RIFOXYA2_FULL_46_9]OGC65712.1 MAG: hypothetical protein A3K34_00275 [candidate division WWE3 bacterium RIFOXYC1_FULL_40_10]OGC67758.1 MAG: hypothetical protein A2450_03090 [candidate division WWE3 bacterium RIFOXYC2
MQYLIEELKRRGYTGTRVISYRGIFTDPVYGDYMLCSLLIHGGKSYWKIYEKPLPESALENAGRRVVETDDPGIQNL